MGDMRKAQSAIGSSCGSTDLSSQRQMVHSSIGSGRTAGTLLGQGATEYLVLLAVVLIIALVGIALLGFFPGTASDAQVAESQLYWQSASPIAVVETAGARYLGECWSSVNCSYMIFRIRNNGAYPIRLSKMLGGGDTLDRYYNPGIGGYEYFSSVYLAPGEEFCVGNHYAAPNSCNNHSVFITPIGTNYTGGYNIDAAPVGEMCLRSNFMRLKDFGFEYAQYVEGQQLTKRQVGAKDLVVRCTATG